MENIKQYSLVEHFPIYHFEDKKEGVFLVLSNEDDLHYLVKNVQTGEINSLFKHETRVIPGEWEVRKGNKILCRSDTDESI